MTLYTQLLTKNDCYKAGRTIVPKGVMVHSTGANNPNVCRYVPGNDIIGRNRLGNHWDRPGVEKCVHAFIGKLADGSVGTVQTLPWTCRGWHAGGAANNTHVSFEICEDGLKDPAYFATVYREAAELTAYLCREFGLDPLAAGTVICHQEGYRRGVASSHADVLHWFPRQGKTMDDFRADVVRIMKEGKESEESEMTEEQIRAIVRDELAKIEAERAGQPAPDWARNLLADAVTKGITDGTRPMSTATRMEAAIMAGNVLKQMEN